MRFPTYPLLVLVSWLAACGGATAEGPDPEGGDTVATEVEASPPPGDPCPGAGCPDLDAYAAQVVGRLRAISTPVRPDWETEVRAIMVESYDTDGSGVLQTTEEVDAILCEVWRTVNHGYGDRSNEGLSVREAYGFAPATFWVDGLAIDRGQREHLRQRLLECGIR